MRTHKKKNLAPYLFGWLALAAVLVLACPPAYSLTCEECQALEKKSKVFTEELEEKTKELKTAFTSRAYDKVATIRDRISDLRKQLFDMSRSRDACVGVCTPDGMKRDECLKIKMEIAKLESDEPQSQESAKKTDELYLRLLNCNKELKQLLGETH